MIKGYILTTYRIETIKGLNLRSSTKGAITAFFSYTCFVQVANLKLAAKVFILGIESALTVDSYDGYEFETSMDS